MQKISAKAILLIISMVVCQHLAKADSYSAEDAAKRDNIDAWAKVLQLEVSAYELSSMNSSFEPGYELFWTKKACNIQEVHMQFDSSDSYITTECHRVGPNSKLANFWSLEVLKDGKFFTEVRFQNQSACVGATTNVHPQGNVNYEAICVNAVTHQGSETGE
jgi:hypothetical protein